MEEIAIKVENLGKKYLIGHQKSGSISDRVRNIFSPKNKEVEEFWALKEVNFEIKRGEAVGIIGKNGAGKSTLLKILSRITAPSTGRFEISGRVSSLLEVGTGFHPELSGRENIYLNGTILGMSRREIKAKFDEIVAFSGVEKFLDTPVKHYSSGMYVRLAFSVAAHLEPEILIIDEVLAVGDAEFQKKCLGKMDEVAKGGRTVLFVSHNMEAVQRLCSKSILLKNGEIGKVGTCNEVIQSYQEYYTTQGEYLQNENPNQSSVLLKANILNHKREATNCLFFREPFFINTEWINREGLKNLVVSIRCHNQTGQFVFGVNSMEKLPEFERMGKHEVLCSIKDNSLTPGKYTLDIGSFIRPHSRLEFIEKCIGFEVLESSFDDNYRFLIKGSPLTTVKEKWDYQFLENIEK